MTKICFEEDFGYKSLIKSQWSILTRAFDVEVVSRNANLDSLKETLVVLSSDKASILKGTIPLTEYTHPKDAIYYFGSDHSKLDLKLKKGTDVVYIPIKEQLWAVQAACIVLYDRLLKNGR